MPDSGMVPAFSSHRRFPHATFSCFATKDSLGFVLCHRQYTSLERVLAIRLGRHAVRIDGHVDEHGDDDDRSRRNDDGVR